VNDDGDNHGAEPSCPARPFRKGKEI